MWFLNILYGTVPWFLKKNIQSRRNVNIDDEDSAYFVSVLGISSTRSNKFLLVSFLFCSVGSLKALLCAQIFSDRNLLLVIAQACNRGYVLKPARVMSTSLLQAWLR